MLIDDVLRVDWKNSLTLTKDIHDPADRISRAERFYISNVAQYYYANHFETTQLSGSILKRSSDYPILTPPFKDFWMEFSTSGMQHSKLAAARNIETRALDVGWRFVSHEVTEGHRRIALESRGKDDYPEDARWLLMADGPYHSTAERLVGKHYKTGTRFFLDARGSCISVDEPYYRNPFFDDVPPPDEEEIRDCEIWLETLMPCLLAISFLHCHNVRVREQELSRQQRRWAERHGKPLARYHVLEIEPMADILRTDGQVETQGLSKALHITRGHFKRFTDKGLFGKLRGMYWWDAHLRGNPNKGVVTKDYRLGQVPEQSN